MKWSSKLQFALVLSIRKQQQFMGGYSTAIIAWICMYFITTSLYPHSIHTLSCRSARRNSAYSEEPDGGLLLELALNPHLQQLPSESPVSVRDRRPMISPMSSEDETVAGKGKAASIPAVVC